MQFNARDLISAMIGDLFEPFEFVKNDTLCASKAAEIDVSDLEVMQSPEDLAEKIVEAVGCIERELGEENYNERFEYMV